jgi:hypothetical protein
MPSTPRTPADRTLDGSVYRAVLGPAFAQLHPFVQQAHLAPLVATGTLDVERGRHWTTPILAHLMSLPRAGTAQPVRLDVFAAGDGMRWRRRIGRVPLQTTQQHQDGRLVERHGLGRIVFSLEARGGALLYHQVAMHVGGLPVPDRVAPQVTAIVAPDVEGWTVNVHVTWRGRLVCRYAGRIRAA